MSAFLPPSTQTPLELPALISGQLLQELQALVTKQSPLQAHFEAFHERAAYLAECQAMVNESLEVNELEESVCEMIDAQHDAAALKQAVLSVAQSHARGSMAGQGDTASVILEQTELGKVNYRDLTPAERYGRSKAFEDFKRRVFGIQHPEDDYPGTDSFFRRPNKRGRTGPASNGEVEQNGGAAADDDDQHQQEQEDDEDDDFELTYRTKRTLKCPITMTLFQDPMRSKVCVHVYSKTAIFEMIRRNRGATDCPVAGCDKIITEFALERDRVMERRVRQQVEEDETRDAEVLSSENGEEDVLDIL